MRSHAELAGLSVVVTLYYLAHNSLASMGLTTPSIAMRDRRESGTSLALVGVLRGHLFPARWSAQL